LDGLRSVEFDSLTELFELGQFEAECLPECELLGVEEGVRGDLEVSLADRDLSFGVIQFDL
jgi:hypothetical protein